MTIKKLKLRSFILTQQKNGESLAPIDITTAYNHLAKKQVSLQAVSQMLKRMNLNAEQRKAVIVEKARLEAGKDIEDYQEIKSYLANADIHGTTRKQIVRQLYNIRHVWELMDKTDPHTWTAEAVLAAIKKEIPMVEAQSGRMQFSKPAMAGKYLSAVNTFFRNILPPKFSAGLNRAKGELVDNLSFIEFKSLLDACEDDNNMSALGWRAMFCAHVNLGCREGTSGKTGIVSLRWDDINFETKRCKLREKGGHGHAGRVWDLLPLDLFKWLNGWEMLMQWHYEKHGYMATNEQHASGEVFPVNYQAYLEEFHAARKRAGGRIGTDKETLTPHIIRKTHAQWCKKLRIPLEIIAGKFPAGMFGVGWDNLSILKDFYTSVEPDEYEDAENKASARMKLLGLV